MDNKSDELHKVSENEEDDQIDIRNTVVVKDSSVFRMGECFDSYDDLLKRLASHSKQSLVHYWRRDSRTVQGAFMKTSRPIEAKLVYYSVKYACVFGGQKFFPKGKGQRNSMTMRSDCPAHIMVRASKSGRQLEVISVCNTHNHPVSRELYRRLPQDRKLSPIVKQEVLDLLCMGVERKSVRDYVRAVTGKVLTNKDLLNLGATIRKQRPSPKPERAIALLKALRRINASPDALEGSDDQLNLADSTDSQESAEDSIRISEMCTQVRSSTHINSRQSTDDILNADDVLDDQLDCPLYETITEGVGREVEIFYEEETSDTKNIIEYLYPSIIDSYAIKGEPDLTNSDVIIKNIGLVTTEATDIEMNEEMTTENITEDMEMMVQEQTFQQSQDCLSQEIVDNNKVKLKLINLESLFPNENKVLIQQSPDGNENTLLQNFQSLSNNSDESGIDLKNILVIRGSITESEMCGVPIQMYKISADGTDEDISELITLQDNQEIMTFAEGQESIIVDSLSEQCITTLDCQNDDIQDNTINDIDLGDGVICNACGKPGQEVEIDLDRLRNEKEKLEREVKQLRMKRDKLRGDIRKERVISKRLAKASALRNNNIEVWKAFGDSDENDSERIQFICVP